MPLYVSTFTVVALLQTRNKTLTLETPYVRVSSVSIQQILKVYALLLKSQDFVKQKKKKNEMK